MERVIPRLGVFLSITTSAMFGMIFATRLPLSTPAAFALGSSVVHFVLIFFWIMAWWHFKKLRVEYAAALGMYTTLCSPIVVFFGSAGRNCYMEQEQTIHPLRSQYCKCVGIAGWVCMVIPAAIYVLVLKISRTVMKKCEKMHQRPTNVGTGNTDDVGKAYAESKMEAPPAYNENDLPSKQQLSSDIPA